MENELIFLDVAFNYVINFQLVPFNYWSLTTHYANYLKDTTIIIKPLIAAKPSDHLLDFWDSEK